MVTKRVPIVVMCLLIIIFPIFSDNYSLEGTHLVMGTGVPKDNPFGRHYVFVFDELSRRLGFTYEYRELPAERANILAINGQIDGEFLRVFNYGKLYPVMKRVPTPINYIRISAITHIPGLQFSHWSDLADSDIVVIHRKGAKFIENNLPLYKDAKHIIAIEDNLTGYMMMKMGRGDIFLTALLSPLEDSEFASAGLYSAGIIGSITSHIYFHESNEHLIPFFDKEMQEMKEEGLLEVLRLKAGVF